MYVQDDTDIKSFIAYALYKQQKTTFVKSLIQDNRKPSDIERALNDFVENSCNSTFIDGNKERATKLLALYEATYFNDEAKSLIKNLETKINSVSDVATPKSSIWRDIGVNLLASLFWVIILALIGFLYNVFASEDFQDLILKKLGEIIENAISTNQKNKAD